MFGFGKRNDQPDAQVPYEVYETANQPSVRRRQWIIRLAAALIAVTLLVFAGLAFSRWLLSRGANPSTTGQSQGQGGQNGGNNNGNDVQPPEGLRQGVQQNENRVQQDNGKPESTPLSGSDNKSTVRQPE